MIQGIVTALRAIEIHDLPQLLEWRNNPLHRRFFREYRELNSAQQRTWFETKVNNDPSTRMFAIVEHSSGALLGACGLCYIDWINRSADFSIYIGHRDLYIDQTFAPDAAQLLMKYGFDELGLNRLWAEIYSFDVQKSEFFVRMGFSLEGRHRQTHWTEGAWCDSLFYGLVRADMTSTLALPANKSPTKAN